MIVCGNLLSTIGIRKRNTSIAIAWRGNSKNKAHHRHPSPSHRLESHALEGICYVHIIFHFFINANHRLPWLTVIRGGYQCHQSPTVPKPCCAILTVQKQTPRLKRNHRLANRSSRRSGPPNATPCSTLLLFLRLCVCMYSTYSTISTTGLSPNTSFRLFNGLLLRLFLSFDNSSSPFIFDDVGIDAFCTSAGSITRFDLIRLFSLSTPASDTRGVAATRNSGGMRMLLYSGKVARSSRSSSVM